MIRYLHIYGQSDWHSEAFIVGDREALIFLRNAIDRAIENGKPESVGIGRGRNTDVSLDSADSCVFVNDGEGYEPIVICASPETMDKMAVPYTDEIAQERRDNVIWPGVLIYTKHFNSAGEEIDEQGNLVPNGENNV